MYWRHKGSSRLDVVSGLLYLVLAASQDTSGAVSLSVAALTGSLAFELTLWTLACWGPMERSGIGIS
jgi:hypothetical protein